jgi:CRP-like cAMP-binding protein
MVIAKSRETASSRASPDPGADAPGVWTSRVDHGLRNLGDRAILNRSPLAKVTYVQKYAAEKCQGHLLPRGLAVRDILISCVDRISTELGDDPALARPCAYLKMLVQGLSRTEISRQLGLSREHVSRQIRKRALELVTEEFLATTGMSR